VVEVVKVVKVVLAFGSSMSSGLVMALSSV
jgi:hypothetical protein